MRIESRPNVIPESLKQYAQHTEYTYGGELHAVVTLPNGYTCLVERVISSFGGISTSGARDGFFEVSVIGNNNAAYKWMKDKAGRSATTIGNLTKDEVIELLISVSEK